MENFRKVLKKRLSLMVSFNVVAAAFIGLIGAYGNMTAISNDNIAEMIHGFQVGIFLGLQIVMLLYISKYRNALRDEEKLKRLYIEEHDERTKLIKEKIGGVGFNFTLGAIGTATIVSGFLSEVVFLTLLGVLLFTVFVKGFLKLYYRNKL